MGEETEKEEIGITLQELKERRENEGSGMTEIREWSIRKLEETERKDREKNREIKIQLNLQRHRTIGLPTT